MELNEGRFNLGDLIITVHRCNKIISVDLFSRKEDL